MWHRIPSQPDQDPKENVRAMTLRSGKELKEHKKRWDVELEIEVKESKPDKNKDTTQEVGENKKEL